MSTVTTRETAERPTPAAGGSRRAAWARQGAGWSLVTLAGLVAAWLLPVVTHENRVDWLLPVAIWLLTASLLRSGRSLLDRLVLAAVLLVGTTCVAGLVLSLWPWGMRPVPVAGTALTALVLVGAVLRRRPHLPAPRGSDALALGSGVLAAVVVSLPFAGRDFAGRMALMALAEDMARHFSLYDAISTLQSYAFLDRDASAPFLLQGIQTYPQGSHFLAALLDTFLRSGAGLPAAVTAWDHYVIHHIAGFAFFAVVMVWAARWVAGPALTGWPRIAVFAFVAAAVSFSELVTMFIRGYTSEILGLALFAVLLALLARPPRFTRELIVLAAALIVGIGWVYFFLLPLAGLVAVASVIGYRHRIASHWVTALVTAVPAVTLALAPYLVMYSERDDVLADLLPGGPVEGVDRGLTVGIAAVLLAGLATVPRSPVWRMVGTQLVIVSTVSVALGIYQIMSIGHLSYYFDKAVHALFVTCLVGLSGATPLLAKIRRTRRRPVQDAAVGTLVVFAVLAAFGAVPLQRPGAEKVEPLRNVSWGLAYAAGNLDNQGVGKVVAEVLRRYPQPDGRLTQVIFTNDGASYLCSLFVSVLYRNYGTLSRQPLSATPLYEFENMHVTVTDFPAPRRLIVVNSPQTADQLREVLAARPDLDVDLVSLRIKGARV